MKFNYEKAFAKASKGYKYWDRENSKYLVDPSKFEFEMKWYPRLKVFKYKRRSDCTFNPETLVATSYGHWDFVRQVKGKIIFNDHSYSVTTRRHQYMVKNLLKELGIKVYMEVNTGKSLNESLDGTLYTLYSTIFQYEIENARKGAKPSSIKYRKTVIKDCYKDIEKLMNLGASINSRTLKELKESHISNENYRLEVMQRRTAERKALRDRIKHIMKSDPKDLNPKDLTTEQNADVRRALVNRVGINRVLVELNAKVLDKQGDYSLLDLRLSENEWRARPYLKMVNPSTGEIHVEGVPPHIKTVSEALNWRNGTNGAKFINPIKLT